MYEKIRWEVIHWKKLGRTIGFPTANIALKKEMWIAEWTYKVNGMIRWRVYSWVATYRWAIELFEAHFFDFSQDIYWENIDILIIKKIRDNMKFHWLEEIQEQIIKDVDASKKKSKNVLTFGTFDVIHPWHEYYLNMAKMYSDTLITIIATDKNVEKIKWKKPLYPQEKRNSDIEKLQIADIVHIWSDSNPMKWIEMYKPDVICLWYDQKWFSGKIALELKKHNLLTLVIRIDSLEPGTYKSSKFKNK
jgi:FAD synthase